MRRLNSHTPGLRQLAKRVAVNSMTEKSLCSSFPHMKFTRLYTSTILSFYVKILANIWAST